MPHLHRTACDGCVSHCLVSAIGPGGIDFSRILSRVLHLARFRHTVGLVAGYGVMVSITSARRLWLPIRDEIVDLVAYRKLVSFDLPSGLNGVSPAAGRHLV